MLTSVLVVLVVAFAALSAGLLVFPRTETMTSSVSYTLTETETVTATVAQSATATTGGQDYPTPSLNSSVSVLVGGTFAIQLSSDAGSTGYDWKVSTSTGIQYLNYTVVSTGTLVGSSQMRDYFFRAVQAGSQTIILQNERSFAPYAIAETINIVVAVY